MTEKSPTTSQEDDNEPLVAKEAVPSRQPRQPPIHFMLRWTLTMHAKDKLEPLMVVEALESKHWTEAMEREYRSLLYNKTWELVLLPPNITMISGNWCYRAKIDPRGTIQRHKAKYVAQGFTQRRRVDFRETTSQLVAQKLFWALLAIATERDMEIKQLDVDSVFLYGNLNKDIYLKQREGF